MRLIEELCPQKDGIIYLNHQDEMLRNTMIIEKGLLTWPPPVIAPTIVSSENSSTTPIESKSLNGAKDKPNNFKIVIPFILVSLGLIFACVFAPSAFIFHLTVFILSCFIGYMVVWNVTPALHTPLMSVTNAISSIVILGALMQGSNTSELVNWLAIIAIFLTTINMVGGFLVTHRMLRMFQK